MFTGSEKTLENLIITNLQPLIAGGDPAAAQNLQKAAAALSKAIVAWIKIAGVNSVVAQIAPGQSVVTSGSPTTQSGATVSPGSIASSSLI